MLSSCCYLFLFLVTVVVHHSPYYYFLLCFSSSTPSYFYWIVGILLAFKTAIEFIIKSSAFESIQRDASSFYLSFCLAFCMCHLATINFIAYVTHSISIFYPFYLLSFVSMCQCLQTQRFKTYTYTNTYYILIVKNR